jgi:gluconolactonase
MTSLKLALALSALALASSAAAAAETKVLNDDAWFAEGPIWYNSKAWKIRTGEPPTAARA